MSIIDGDLTTLAFCWRVERRDGAAVGFTTHDRDMSIGPLVYRATPGMLPSALSLSDGFDANMVDIGGALSSDAISESDLKAGRWDGASVRIFLADWRDPEAEEVPLARGTLGDVAIEGGGFTAELRGPTALLERPVVEQTSPGCRAELGDTRCGVDMAGRTRIARVMEAVSDEVIELDGAPAAAGAYRYGRLRWISGANSGLESAVLGSTGGRLTLREPPPFSPEAGDLVEIAEGCDKNFETCIARFANAANFRGEPYLPGMDLLTRYPGA